MHFCRLHFATTDLRGSVPLKYDWYYALRFTVYYGCGGQGAHMPASCWTVDPRANDALSVWIFASFP